MSSFIANGTTLRMSFKCGDEVKTTTSQYKVARLTASMTVSIATAVTDNVVGIIESMQSAGSEVCSVITHGVARGIMQTATSCAIGVWLVANPTGTLETAITNTTAQIVVGRALTVPATGGAVVVYVTPIPTFLV